MNKKIEAFCTIGYIQLKINNFDTDYEFLMDLSLDEAKELLNSLSQAIKTVEEKEQEAEEFVNGYFPFDPREEYDL